MKLKLALVLFTVSTLAQAQTLEESIRRYSAHVHASYAKTLKTAEELRDAIRTFTTTPSVITHEMAKAAWVNARAAYGPTEVFRFYNGPIDRDGGPEGLLNAWPLDEAYIDYVAGNPNAGIINNLTEFPEITTELLIQLNELDGQKNISTGYHAIEFLLWGQDFFVESVGQRAFTDYTTAPNADRRAQYLNIVADLIVSEVAGLESEWRPGENNYRREFESKPTLVAMKNLLSGIIFMAGDELSGERMYVAYDTRGQEDEHSCFSDMTHKDIEWNFRGVEGVVSQTGILEIPVVASSPAAARVRARLASSNKLIMSIPVPFDQAIGNEAGRDVILRSVEELEALAKDLVDVSVLLNARVDY